VERLTRGERPLCEPNDDWGFRVVPRNDRRHVDGPCLADPVHAARALLEPNRIPGQLQVDDGAGASL